MENISPKDISLLSSFEIQKEGLPFWLFYFLLSLILLLIFINFLQNKDLRQKLSYTLAGPRRRLHGLRLQVKLRKEEEKKAELFRRLGKLVSTKWPDLPEIEEIASEIRSLEEVCSKLQALWHEIYKNLEILKLKKRKLLLPENSGEKNPKELKELDEKIAGLEKNKAEIQEKLLATNEVLEPQYETVGRVIYKSRLNRQDLAFLYFQINKTEEKIKILEKEIKNPKNLYRPPI